MEKCFFTFWNYLRTQKLSKKLQSTPPPIGHAAHVRFKDMRRGFERNFCPKKKSVTPLVLSFFGGGGNGGAHFRRGGRQKSLGGGDLKIFCVQNKPKKPKKICACGGRTRKDFTQGICFTAEFGHFLGTKLFFWGK